MPQIISKEDLKKFHEPITVIFRESSMGDIIACEPIVDVVNRMRPKNKIAWMIRPQFVDLLIAHPNIDYLVFTGDRDETIMFIKELPENFWPIPLYMNFRDKSRQKKYGSFLHVNRLIDANSYTHWGPLVDMYCRTAFLPRTTRGPQFHFIDSDTPYLVYDRYGNQVKKYVVFHCLASKETPMGRNWTIEGWVALLDYFISKQIHVVEVGLEPVINCDSEYYINKTMEHSLQNVAKIIRGTSLFIGIDSGFAHVANALEVDGVLLFGLLRNYFRRHVFYTGKYRYNHILRAKGKNEASTIEARQVIRFIENKDKAWSRLLGYGEGFYNLYIYNQVLRIWKGLYRLMFSTLSSRMKDFWKILYRGVEKSMRNVKWRKVLSRLKSYARSAALLSPIKLLSVENSNASLLKNIQYFLILKEACPEVAQLLMPKYLIEITPEIQEYISNGYYSQLKQIQSLKNQYQEVVRDSILNLLGTAQGKREEFIWHCLELARTENNPVGIYVSLFKEMKMAAASPDVLEEVCCCFINTPNIWNTGSAQLEAWALCLGILAQSPKSDLAATKKILSKHESIFKLAGLERDLGASLNARRNGFANKMISDSALILEKAEEHEDNNTFINYIKNKRVAIVGNGPQEIGSGNGKIIDSYDIVIRFNDFVISREFAKDYGQKTNIWAIGARLTPRDPANLKEIDIIVDPLGVRRFLYPKGKIVWLLQHITVLKKVFVGIPTSFYNNLLEGLGFGRPTSGLIMAAYVKYINPDFSITDMYGFSFKTDIVAAGKNQEMIAQHYYDSRPGVKMPHSTLNENAFFRKLFS